MHSFEFDLGMEDFIAFCPSHPFKANHFHDHPSFAESSQWIGGGKHLAASHRSGAKMNYEGGGMRPWS